MKKIFIPFFLVFTFTYGETLVDILEKATQNNMILKSKDYVIKSKNKDLKAEDSRYYPEINLGASYSTLNKKTLGNAGDTYELYGKVSFDIYDGGEKHNNKKSLKALYEASKYDKEAFLKVLELSIVQDFFHIKNSKVQLDALIEKNIQLKAELERIKKFYKVGTATKDDIDKLNAEYSNNVYKIDALKHQILSLKRLFVLKIGIEIRTFENSELIKPKTLERAQSDYINVLKQNRDSLTFKASSLESKYLPSLRIENKFSSFEYGRDSADYAEGVDYQNELMLSMNIKLYDNGVYKKQKESLILQKKAIEEQIKQEVLAQNINIELTASEIKTIVAQIKSAKDSYVAASSAFETIRKKFEIGSVDNIAFLDALSVKTSTKAQYETAKNALQVAYAKYYYYLNKNIKDFVK